MAKTRNNAARRRFLRDVGRSATGLAGIALLMAIPQRQARPEYSIALRPPGALGDEQKFMAACIRCGQCVQACPYDTLKSATLFSMFTAGTPYFVGREVPCEMCEDIPCVVACPSGALDPALTDINDARMGLAVLIDQENCLNWLGIRCDACHRICPLINKAITIERRHNERTGKHAMLIPTVHSEYCTGCGKCEEACVLEEAAIKVLPLKLAQGKAGSHYRLGWVEKDKVGHALVPESVPLEVRRPEGDN